VNQAKLFDALIIGQTLAVNWRTRCAGRRTSCDTATRRSAPEEQTLGVVQPPLAASLYSASLT
jgi:hypothetical protein